MSLPSIAKYREHFEIRRSTKSRRPRILCRAVIRLVDRFALGDFQISIQAITELVPVLETQYKNGRDQNGLRNNGCIGIWNKFRLGAGHL